MNLDISKRDRQQSGTLKWRNARGIGTLNWPPRFGKTFGTIEFIINPHLRNNSDNLVIILVPSDIINKQWIDNLKSYGENLDRVAVISANWAVNNLTDDKCSLIIVDEIQKFTTPDRKRLLDGTVIKHHYRLALTGTYPSGVDWIEELYPIVDHITEKEAIDNKWIAPFIEYNLLIPLPENDKARYHRFTNPISETLELFKDKHKLLPRGNEYLLPDEFSLIQACHTGFKTIDLNGKDIWITYDRLCNSLAYKMGWHTELNISTPENAELHKVWSPVAIHDRAKQFIDYIKRRNEILIDNPAKLHLIGEIISRNMVSTICFNESTKFADAIADYINAKFDSNYRAVCYHSKINSRTVINPDTGDYFKYTTGDRKGLPKILGKDTIKRIVIDGARSGYYKFISTAKALDEGVDIPVIEQVICTAGTTNPITYQQRTARGKTIDFYNSDKVTKIINLVFDDFVDIDGNVVKNRDKTKLILRQRETGNLVHWITDLNELNFNQNE
jgi:superfamily II DNA or RNA helicase